MKKTLGIEGFSLELTLSLQPGPEEASRMGKEELAEGLGRKTAPGPEGLASSFIL